MFYALPNKENQTITILPHYLLRMEVIKKHPDKKEFLESLSLDELIYQLNFNRLFAVPLPKVNLKRMPLSVSISNGKATYSSLNEAIDAIYCSRTYTKNEQDAKTGINKLLIKALTTNGKLYGLSWTFTFNYEDLSHYNILL